MRRLFGVLVCGVVVCGAARASDAAPILISNPIGSTTIDGSLSAFNDVALYSFQLAPGSYAFSAVTTSFGRDVDGNPNAGFDPNLALYLAGGPLVTYGDPPEFARNDDNPADPADFNAHLSFDLAVSSPGLFLLAVSQGLNNGKEDALAFEWDLLTCGDVGVEYCAGVGLLGLDPTFSLTLNIEPITATVPEPGTLSLLALGSAYAAAVRRRRLKNSRRSV